MCWQEVKISKVLNFEFFIILNSENLLKKNGLKCIQEIVSEMVWSFQQQLIRRIPMCYTLQ